MKPVDVALKNVIKEFRTGQETFRAVDDITLDIYDGEFFALLGPSGCGKTTTLRMIAGFEDATYGDILIQGKSVRHIPPYRRPVNTVFQDYALFPHMTVLHNVMFGLKMENVRRKEAERLAYEALELVQLPGVASRKPRQLSGGQQQRVALARALVKKPTVLLLDEPLGALDLKLRKAMQFELKAMQMQLGITFIYVTHDQEEAMTMADRIAVMHLGVVKQLGTPEEIYEDPQSRYVADFIGETNFINGLYCGENEAYGQAKLGDGTVIEAVAAAQQPANNAPITIAIRPEKIGVLAREGNIRESKATQEIASELLLLQIRESSDRTLLEGTVSEAFYIGTDYRYHVQIADGTELVCRSQNFGRRTDRSFDVGEQVYVFWDNDSARILTE